MAALKFPNVIHGGSRDDDTTTELALAAARGDRGAFEAWVKATQADVWRFIVHLNGRDTADDLTQETYLRAVRALPRFVGRCASRTWLLAIARRVVVDNIRHRSTRPRITTRDWETEAERAATAGPPSFETVVDTQLLIDRLEPERKEALVLTQMFGFSYAEAAEICACPVGTIRSRVARAREELLIAMREQHNAS